ncbi:hypothetical protein GWK47_026254 [Chionoecetes opilio]|uniref:Uncharacterized protein n=1 Tax=Chionoecetes opilio TaxID=41210 RepID=A0A8J8WMX1_CHIOP|nr:hypothetical protein GWK47_026254 [Chionoecetes opilio]
MPFQWVVPSGFSTNVRLVFRSYPVHQETTLLAANGNAGKILAANSVASPQQPGVFPFICSITHLASLCHTSLTSSPFLRLTFTPSSPPSPLHPFPSSHHLPFKDRVSGGPVRQGRQDWQQRWTTTTVRLCLLTRPSKPVVEWACPVVRDPVVGFVLKAIRVQPRAERLTSIPDVHLVDLGLATRTEDTFCSEVFDLTRSKEEQGHAFLRCQRSGKGAAAPLPPIPALRQDLGPLPQPLMRNRPGCCVDTPVTQHFTQHEFCSCLDGSARDKFTGRIFTKCAPRMFDEVVRVTPERERGRGDG